MDSVRAMMSVRTIEFVINKILLIAVFGWTFEAVVKITKCSYFVQLIPLK